MFRLLAETPPVEAPAWFWEAFVGVVVVLLVLDVLVLHRKPHEVATREAVGWTCFWIALALAFDGWIWAHYGDAPAKQFLTAFVLEKSLSVDNLFVFLLVFQYFKTPPELQHRVLFLGVLGAIVMRFLFISAGVALVSAFDWVNYVFGAFLLFTAAKLFFAGEDDGDPGDRLLVRTLRRALPFEPTYVGTKLTVKRDGRRVATMLLLVLLVIEASDVAFAVDSIPACIGVTRDRFIVFTSNVCAILGLRSIYFLLARFMGAFRYLKPGLALILAFVGVKLFGLHVDDTASLAIICGILAVATTASILRPETPPEGE